MKATKLPEEYIVECEIQEQTIEVLNKYYNSNYTSLNLWEYIICRKDLQRKNEAYGRAIEHFIRPEYKDMPVLSYKEWKELTSKFILPEKWYIKTENLTQEIKKWFCTKSQYNFIFGLKAYGNYSTLGFKYGGITYEEIRLGTEISAEQFQKYILKEEETKTNKTMKKPFAITGSTILKEAFVKEAGLKPCAPESIPDYKYLTPYSKNVVVGHSVLILESIEFSLPKDYDEALEYVKTYWDEEKVKAKEGDWIVPLIESGKGKSGSHSRNVGKVYQINDVNREFIRVNDEYGQKDGNGAIYHGEYRLATPEEIKKVKESQFPEMCGYKGVIEGDLLAYGCKKFNKEELDTIIEASNLLKRLDGYFASITDNSVIVKSTAISIDDLKRASKLLSKKKLEYGGDIKNFPEEVVEKMLDRQVEQGNPRNLSVFEGNKNTGKSSGGFNWQNSIEGGNFWVYVIGYQEFDKFFELYPKNN